MPGCTKSHVEHGVQSSSTSATDADPNSQISYHRPFLRSALARSLYDRMMREEQLRKFDKNKWYKCDLDQISDEELKSKFLEFDCDAETNDFIESCYSKSDWFITHLFHSMVRSILTLFMTSTSVNGFLDRGSMFVFSKEQFSKLYKLPEIKASKKPTYLLDLGAGDGKVTNIMASFFSVTNVTEASPVMRRALAKRGFNVLDIDQWYKMDDATLGAGVHYDLISCLNLLDRCDKPITIINQMIPKLKPNGRILMAVVLPLSQYVENGSNAPTILNDGTTNDGHRPTEVLNVDGESFEEQVQALNQNVLAPNGLEVVKWTRLPYLCEGDLDLSFYWLHDVVLLVKRIGDE